MHLEATTFTIPLFFGGGGRGDEITASSVSLYFLKMFLYREHFKIFEKFLYIFKHLRLEF